MEKTHKGILLFLIAWTFIPIMDGIAKYLSSTIPVMQIVWARYFFTCIIVIPIITYLCGKYSNFVIMCTCIILVIGLIKHWINIKRIYKGEEVGLKSVLNKRNN